MDRRRISSLLFAVRVYYHSLLFAEYPRSKAWRNELKPINILGYVHVFSFYHIKIIIITRPQGVMAIGKR